MVVFGDKAILDEGEFLPEARYCFSADASQLLKIGLYGKDNTTNADYQPRLLSLYMFRDL